MALNATKVAGARAEDKPKKLADSGGLYLEIRPTGSKLWRYRFRIGGKESVVSLGSFPDVSLADARAARDEARRLVKIQKNPSQDRLEKRVVAQQARANTFQAIAEEYWAKMRVEKDWSTNYAEQFKTTFKAHVYPSIGALPIREVTSAQLLKILQRVAERGAPTVAILIRQWASAVFGYAIYTLRAESDPTYVLRRSISRPKVKHAQALSEDEIVVLRRRLANYGGHRTTVIAIELLLLTFLRTCELRGAQWKEFDFRRALWRVPACRMKARVDHFVPLSRQSLTLLEELRTISGGRSYLFPNWRQPGRCMSATTINRALERMSFTGKAGIGFAAHGFRATASTLLNESGNYREDVIERQLAHSEKNKTRGSYNHAKYMSERRQMMQYWADRLDQLMTEPAASGHPFVPAANARENGGDGKRLIEATVSV